MTKKQIVLGILGGIAIALVAIAMQFVINQSLYSAFGVAP